MIGCCPLLLLDCLNQFTQTNRCLFCLPKCHSKREWCVKRVIISKPESATGRPNSNPNPDERTACRMLADTKVWTYFYLYLFFLFRAISAPLTSRCLQHCSLTSARKPINYILFMTEDTKVSISFLLNFPQGTISEKRQQLLTGEHVFFTCVKFFKERYSWL